MPFSNTGPREVGKLLDQLKTVVDPSGRPEMSLLMVPHVAIGLAVLAQKQQASITDLSMRWLREERENIQLTMEVNLLRAKIEWMEQQGGE